MSNTNTKNNRDLRKQNTNSVKIPPSPKMEVVIESYNPKSVNPTKE